MERKRRSHEDTEYIKNKIRKLERRLLEKRRRRVRVIDSSDSENSEENGPASSDTNSRASRRDTSPQRSQRDASPTPGTSHQTPAATPGRDPAPPASPQPGPSSAPDQQVTAVPVSAPSVLEDVELGEDILNLLGDAPKLDTPFGKGIHKDVASRWQDILNKGLQKEIKEKLAKEYLVPQNCTLLVPPILNPEAKAALSEALVRRDTSLLLRQKQLALALSALGQATDILIKQKSAASDVLKRISDACRILCDSHFAETKLRRNFVIASINTNLKETLIDTERDNYLFGENVSDKLKVAQAVQKSGNSLKNSQKTFNKANFTIKNKYRSGNLNSNTPYQKTTNSSKSDTGRPRQAARPAPAPPASTRYNNRHRVPVRERSPPRKYPRKR